MAQCRLLSVSASAHAKNVLPLAALEAAASASGSECEIQPPSFIWVPALIAARASKPKPSDTPWTVRSWSFDAMMTVLLLGFAQREEAVAHLRQAHVAAGPQPPVQAASKPAAGLAPSDWAGIYDALKRPPLSPAARSGLASASWSLRRAAGVFSYAATAVSPLLTDSLAPRTRRGWSTVRVPPDVVSAPQRAIHRMCMAETAVCICLVSESAGNSGLKAARLWAGAAAEFQAAVTTLAEIVSRIPSCRSRGYAAAGVH